MEKRAKFDPLHKEQVHAILHYNNALIHVSMCKDWHVETHTLDTQKCTPEVSSAVQMVM